MDSKIAASFDFRRRAILLHFSMIYADAMNKPGW